MQYVWYLLLWLCAESVLGVKMMHSQLLHSHLERQNVPHEQLKAQV
jgi:hypothetical protein